jgi:hypothetical protein
MLKLVALVALSLLVATATGLSMEERMHALEAKVEKSVLPEGALLTFADGRTKCPVGYAEPAHLKGRMMTTIPINGTSGAVFNRPFDAGEIGRTPAHSHAVSVNDPGHTHVNIVNDPGHDHDSSITDDFKPGGTYDAAAGHDGIHPARDDHIMTQTNKTGISVVALPAKSSIEVSIDANDAGEHYPLVYVLLCQKLP